MERSREEKEDLRAQLRELLPAVPDGAIENIIDLDTEGAGDCQIGRGSLTIYDKSYYTRKTSPYEMERCTYRLALDYVRFYPLFCEKLEEHEQRAEGELDPGGAEHLTVIDLKRLISIIEDGLKVVPKEYRKAVWDHAVTEKSLTKIALENAMSESTLARCYEAYVKEVGRGMTVDLAILKKVFDNSLGWIHEWAWEAVLEYMSGMTSFEELERKHGTNKALIQTEYERFLFAFSREFGIDY